MKLIIALCITITLIGCKEEKASQPLPIENKVIESVKIKKLTIQEAKNKYPKAFENPNDNVEYTAQFLVPNKPIFHNSHILQYCFYIIGSSGGTYDEVGKYTGELLNSGGPEEIYANLSTTVHVLGKIPNVEEIIPLQKESGSDSRTKYLVRLANVAALSQLNSCLINPEYLQTASEYAGITNHIVIDSAEQRESVDTTQLYDYSKIK